MAQDSTFLPAPYRRKRLLAFIAALCAVGLSINISIAVVNHAGWGVDYNQFYSASRLAGTGHLYDWNALRKIEAENGLEVPTGRLPVVLYGHKILGSLPYLVARSVWLGCSLTALLFFAAFWPGAKRSLMLPAVAWSIPAALLVLYGQDEPFWLMFFTAGLVLMEKKKPWSAGVAFSLCICKFHLALGIPVLLVAQKRGKTLIAGAASFLALIGVSFLIEGPQWPLEYLKNSQMQEFSPSFEVMPNIYALANRFPWPAATEISCAVVIVLLLWAVCRVADVGMAGAAAAACGLLIGHHALAADTALLIPFSVLIIQKQPLPSWLRIWALLMLSPLPMALLLSQNSLLWQILTSAFVVTALRQIPIAERTHDGQSNLESLPGANIPVGEFY